MKSFVSCLSGVLAFLSAVECFAAPPKKNAPKYDPGIEVGQDANGLRFPVFEGGSLQMYFMIDSAKRVDNDHLQMANAQIQTYNSRKEPELKINLLSALLDLNTRVVTSDRPVTISRSDFQLSGQGAVYDTVSGEGKLTGKVRMLIFDGDKMAGAKGGS